VDHRRAWILNGEETGQAQGRTRHHETGDHQSLALQGEPAGSAQDGEPGPERRSQAQQDHGLGDKREVHDAPSARIQAEPAQARDGEWVRRGARCSHRDARQAKCRHRDEPGARRA
jgi:hypothetical protein